MSIRNVNSNRWLVRVRTRINGKQVERKTTVTGDRHQAKAAEVSLRKGLAETAADKQRSLKICTLSEALTFYRENTTANLERVETYLNRLDRELGTVQLRDLSERFGEYLNMLKTERAQRTGNLLSPVTRNRLLVYAKTALSFCMKRGHIERNPLAGFTKLPEAPRDRILTQDEEARLLAVLQRKRSYLVIPVKFSLRNPIRKGDLVSLTRENLDRFRPWIHFLPSKTRNRKNRETVLPFLDSDLLSYFDGLHPECPYLFPQGTRKGEYVPLGDFKKHWHSMLVEARIDDFRWHDLKHCAITWMLDNGYTERDLRNLGIQYSPAMINRYYHTDAAKVLSKWKSAQDTYLEQYQKTAT
ncbi:MAG: tyrosine-type recombinase/integrase [Chitinispirillaceae bacterium]|nr:tyrosine-type recombinase/integrase [Chitinispirillaceae bacterium]